MPGETGGRRPVYSLYTFTMGAIDLARRCPRGRFAELAGIHAQGFPVRCSAAASEGRAKVPCVCHFTTSASSSIIASFLRNVTAGRGIPDERLKQVGEHYFHFNGRSPLNDLNLEIIVNLKAELLARGHNLPVYFGNRNWHPMV